jgi:hypothetical protein
MSSRSLSLWLTLSALILGVAGVGCGGGGNPPLPPNPPSKDLPDATRSKVEVDRTASVANGKDAVNITVTVVKADGVALADRTVNLAVTGDGNTLTPTSGKTDAQGVLRATLTSNRAGAKMVTATVEDPSGPVVLGTRPTITFTLPAAARLAFITQSIQATAGSPLSPTVQVELRDADGNRAFGATGEVTLSLATGPAAGKLEGTVTVTAVDGLATFSNLTIKQAGTGYSLRATSGTLTEAVSATFDVAPASPTVLELTGLPASMTAGNSATVQVTLRDAFTNVASNYTGTVRFTSNDPQAVLPAETTFTAGDNGSKSFTGVSLRTAGTRRVTVVDTSNATITGSAEVQVGAAAPSRLLFAQQPGSRQSVRASLGNVQVRIVDAYGNTTAVNAPAITVALVQQGVTLDGVTQVSPVDGVATFSGLSVAQEGTDYTLRATAQGLTDAVSTAFTIVDDVPPSKPVLTQGATTASSIVVRWTAVGDDMTFGTAASQQLRYSTSPITTEAHFDAATEVVTGAPQAAGTMEQATLSGLTPGTTYYVALRVTDNAGNSARSDALQVSTPNPTVTQLAFITQPVDTTAGTPMADVRVALQDANGNTVTSANSAVALTLNGNPVGNPVAAMNGVATFSGITLNVAGTYVFEASSGGLPPVQSASFTIRPASASKLVLVGLVTPVGAGASNTLQVTARDQFDNVATGYRGTVRFTSNDAAATLPADYTFTAADAGVKTFPGVVLRTAGSVTVTVTDTVNAALTDSLTVNVTGGAATQLVLQVPGTPVTAGSPFSVTVTLRDASNNIATGYTGTVRFTSNDGAAVLPADYTFTAADAGQKTFSAVELRTAGSRTLTAQDTATATLTDTESLTVNAAQVATLQLTAPATAAAGSSFSVTVSARDAFNNVATGYTGTVQFSSDDTRATLPGNYTFTAADAGSRVFSATLGTVGTQPLRVTDGTRNASANITVTPGTATRLTLTGLPGSVTAGVAASVTVTAYDVFDNVATGYTGTVRFTSTDASAQLPADYTFTAADAGDALFSVELRTAGSRTVTVTDVGSPALSASASTTVGPNSPAQLAFTTQPANGTVRATLAAVSVALRDAYGNATTANAPQVTVGLTGGNPAAILSGTLSVDPANGVATFTDLSIQQEGTGFQLVASGQDLTPATSAAFTITDNIAPSTPVITATPASATSVTVTWTAVGDDGNLGTAASYDLRYATTPINNDAQFDAATQAATPAPQAPGSVMTQTVSGLNLATTHYFALRVGDGAGNFSRSDDVSVGGDPCTGVVCTPPAASCSANGTSVVTYASACVVSNGVGVCQDTPTTTRCQSYETCGTGACVPVTAGSQAGSIVISEFSALGSEFIELHNTTGADINVVGYTFRNAAGNEVAIRHPSDPNGTAGTAVTVTAGGYLYGIPNPSGAIPAGVGFVYGAPGTSFALVDTGDAVALYRAAPAGNLEDAVDFRSFVSDPNAPLTTANFVGLAGSSSQLDPTSLTAAANDTAINWCVSFYPAGSKASRVTNTASAANGSCKVAVINEVLFDPFGLDEPFAFVEIAGPGGGVIGGAKLIDIEGAGGQAGTRNTDGENNPGDTDAEYTFPAGFRIPVDGVLFVADTDAAGNTSVPNYVAGVDLKTRDMDLENGPNEAVQLVSASGTLLDALGYDPAGANLAVAVAFNGLAMYESATALGQSAANTGGSSLARATTSVDTDNNRNDFHLDPSPTPGLPNDTLNFTVTNLTPDDGPATNGVSSMTVTGTDLAAGLRVQIGAGAQIPCTVNTSSTTATCSNIMASPGGAVGRVNVTFSNQAQVAVPNFVLVNGFTYTGRENETGSALEADFCNLQHPPTISVPRNTMTPDIFGRFYEAGVSEAPGPAGGVIAEVGYGTLNANPSSSNSWRFFPASYNLQIGNDDEYMGTFLAPNPSTATSYSYTFRFSQDGGLRWTYCDLNGAGSDPGMDLETSQFGVLSVTLPAFE